MSLILEVPNHLSWSQVSNLVGSYCPGQYFYGRGLGLAERPTWASVGGSAVHSASEDWDRLLVERGELVEDQRALKTLFDTAFDIEIAKTEQGTDSPRADWRASGRVSKDYPDKENERWWRDNGPSMLGRWVTWRLGSGWEIAVLQDPDGAEVFGIEIPFEVELGGVKVIGFVDRVFQRGGQYLCVDLKSGSMEPKSTGQLGTYRVGVLETYGVDCKLGAYWMARSGQSASLADLTQWTTDRLDFTYREAREVQLRGAFVHRPSNMCGACAFNEFCPEVNGPKAGTVPQPWDVTEVRVKPPKSVAA